jgi:crossover junction endodeoxyribonuclease RuvC
MNPTGKFIVSIDPGFANVGYVVYNTESKSIVSSGVIRTKRDAQALARDDNLARFNTIYQAILNIFPKDTRCLVVESMSQPRDSRASWKLALGWGAVLAVAYAKNLPVYQITPMDLKFAMTGNKKASKDDVIASIRKRRNDVSWPKQKDAHEHVADATAALLTWLSRNELKQ